MADCQKIIFFINIPNIMEYKRRVKISIVWKNEPFCFKFWLIFHEI